MELMYPLQNTMTMTTEKNQPIEFRLRYPKPTVEEVNAFSEVIEKVVVHEDVLAEEAEAIELEAVNKKGEGPDSVEQEEEREKERKLEEIRPEKAERQTCL